MNQPHLSSLSSSTMYRHDTRQNPHEQLHQAPMPQTAQGSVMRDGDMAVTEDWLETVDLCHSLSAPALAPTTCRIDKNSP